MIADTITLRGTRCDPNTSYQQQAISYLCHAQDARKAYDVLLRGAIAEYGDRHLPVKMTATSGCLVCLTRGMRPTEHENLNHQTGSVISGIYADHFPDHIKAEMRSILARLNNYMGAAVSAWRKSGRHASTLLPAIHASYEL